MTQISDDSQKLGLSFGLITTLLVLCAVFRRFLCCCRTNRDYSGDIENGYRNMGEQTKKTYIIFFVMMYSMALLNYLTEVIFTVANDKKN